MKLSKKTFKIQQLVENRDDYRIVEKFYILGIRYQFNWWSLDGFNGDILYNHLFLVEDKIKELEQLEEVEVRYRDGSIMLLLIFLSIIIFMLYNLYF